MNASQRPQLLIITETLALPGLERLALGAGFGCHRCRSVREAIAYCRSRTPTAVLAEYHYNPTYSSFTSSLESLIAGLQKYAAQTRLIVISESQRRQHLQAIADRFTPHCILDQPLDEAALLLCLHSIAAAVGTVDGYAGSE